MAIREWHPAKLYILWVLDFALLVALWKSCETDRLLGITMTECFNTRNIVLWLILSIPVFVITWKWATGLQKVTKFETMEQPDKLVIAEVRSDCDTDSPKAPNAPSPPSSVVQSMPLKIAIPILTAVTLATGILYYFMFQSRFQNLPFPRGLSVLFLLTISPVSLGLIFGGIVGLFMWISSRVRGTTRSPHITRTIIYVTGVLALLMPISDLSTTHRASSDTKTSTKVPHVSQLFDYSPQEKARMREIFSQVSAEEDFLTPAVHAEFWGILTSHGSVPPEVAKSTRDSVTEIMRQYQRSFWDDALTALRTGRAFKSVERENLEKDLVRQNLIPEWRVQQNEKVIELISSHKPVELNGESVVFTEELIQLVSSRIEQSVQRVRQLFSPPGS